MAALPFPFPPPPAPLTRRRALSLEVRASDADLESLSAELLALARAVDPRARVAEAPAAERGWAELSFIAIDVETTGFHPVADRVIEVGWVRFEGKREVERFASLVRVDVEIPDAVRRLTGIDAGMLTGRPRFNEIAGGLVDALASADFAVAYNARFDRSFLSSELLRAERKLPPIPWIDPLVFVRSVDEKKAPARLVDAARRFGVDCPSAHRAEHDARATGELLLRLAPRIACDTLAELVDKQERWSRLPEPAPEPVGFGARLLSLFR